MRQKLGHCGFFISSQLALLLVFALGGCASKPNQDTRQDTGKPPAASSTQEAPYVNFSQQHPAPSVVAYDNYRDPLQFINRPIFQFNDWAYRYTLSPLSQWYQGSVPLLVQNGLSNFFSNLKEPLYALNYLLQLKPPAACRSLARFGVNTTLGVLGFADPAESWLDIADNPTSFSHTLASYGVGYGVYLVLPLLGPTSLRGTSSLAYDYFLHPLNFSEQRKTARALLVASSYLEQVPALSRYPALIEEPEDDYIFIRNLYLQRIQRDAAHLRNTLPKQAKPQAETSEDSDS